ncbi:uncharacterized protein LOC115579834 isoform X2 [Sparus aurata]|uniref:uncharacterized protein LOC115579834 isoform X2 n=1 Tax=Sparus aurata TaxID=8175 RepID=UPI0011C1675E|nr:uncharacterized protein LOC115579834 isoform X2 [Sparus aurata]
MSPTEYFRLLVLCLCLLDSGVNCEDAQKGYVLHVQAGQTPKGGHSDERDHKRWSEPSISRIPTAGFKTSSVAREQSGSQPAQEDHTTDSAPPQMQSWYPYPVHRNVPKSRVKLLKKGFSSARVAQVRSTVAHDRSGTKAFPFPYVKKIDQAISESVFSTEAVQVPPNFYRLSKTKLTGGFSPQVKEAPVGFGLSRRALIYSHGSAESPNIKAIKSSLKSESHKTHINPSRPNVFPINPHGSHLPTRPEVSGNPGSSSAGKEETPAWGPRSHSGDVTSEARGYAHVRHIKPSNDKTHPQASSAAGRKFLETGYPSLIQNQGRHSHDSSERRQNLNHNTRGKQPSSWHPPPPDRAPSHVQGKFKPFQRLPTNDPPPHHHSADEETEPTRTAAGTTLSPCLNSTGINSSVVPSVDGELGTTTASPMQTESQDGESTTMSASPMHTESQDGESTTTSASPMQTESQDATLVPQTSNHDGQSESSAEVGSSGEQDKPSTVFPLTVHPAEEEKGDTAVSSPSQKDQSEV